MFILLFIQNYSYAYNQLQVTISFFRFFIVYFFFLLAFGLGFYVSLDKFIITNSPSNSNTSTNNDYKPFSTGIQSFVKTAAMFSGELVRGR